MKTIKNLFLAFILLSIAFSCEKDGQVQEPSEPADIILNEKEQALINSSNEFGFNLFKQINDTDNNNENIFISPISVSLALAMTYNGADGTTKEAMEQTLCLSGLTVDEINDSYKNIINSLVNLDPNVILTIANSIWYRNTFNVEQNFIDVNIEYYNAQVTPLDFSNPNAKDIINSWVAENTNNKITEIIDMITPSNIMFLIDAIYFKGIWKYQFDPENTSDYPFHLQDGSVKYVPMMVQKGKFNYYSDTLMQALELLYGDGKFSMVILLPANEQNVNNIIEQMNPESWETWLSRFYEVGDLQVYLPKFTFSYEKELKEVLSAMGMGIAFNMPCCANFSKINPYFDLYISKVKHKTYVEVNEEGTEAAAVTSVEVSYTSTSVGVDVFFVVNKPFIFAIIEKSTNTVVFTGKVMEPVIE